jgi:acetolactate synthase I/II/III large subunit
MDQTVAGLLARRLKEHGVKRFFGIPGGPSIPYLKAFGEAGIDFILTSHESGAAVMADVTARLTGITGVCHSTFGPGATNMSTGVGGALLDRSPVLALTSEISDDWRERTTQMNIDHQQLFRPLTKATYRLSVQHADEIVSMAISAANEEYPGPVHIGLPAGIAEKTVSCDGHTQKHECETLIADISGLIEKSKRPLIVAGLTAARLGLGRQISELLSTHPIPVVVTPMAKGLIPYNHPCFAGVLFHALSDRLKQLTNEADLIIGLGYDPVEYNYESWIPDVPLVHFNTIKTDLPLKNLIQYVSSPEKWFTVLVAVKPSVEMVNLAEKARTEIRKALSVGFPGFSPVEAIGILNEMLPSGAIVTADVGSHLHLLGQQWQIPVGGRLIMTNGWSSMGFGIPASIAAAFVQPSVPVICITGDGGLLMSAGEIMTARRYGLKVIIIVLSDGELNLIKLKESWKGVTPCGVDLYKDSLFNSNTFLGVRVMHAASPEEFKSYIAQALSFRESTIIEVAIDPSAYGQLVVRQQA